MGIGTVKQIDIDQTMQVAYLDYAMSVIVARALPDVRDGLKPVQRRVLYAMYDMGLRHNSPYKKSARIVGEVLGKYHPHGDAAVYDAMVRLAQDFSMRYPLVDGQGNFGSVDGDSAAAMRYTEARLSAIAQDVLNDIEKDTVNFSDNFDGSLKEPAILPSALPNLLVNGSTGIAVGMATNIPPHNLSEVCDALSYLIDNYKQLDRIDVDDLMKFVHGPDFPTAGLVYRYAGGKDSEDNIKQAYATGKGRVIVQAKTHFEELSRGRSSIIITELPYQVNKTSLIERIAELVRDGRIDGISDLRDESDRQGMRVVIELTRTVGPEAVLKQLYKYTPLQTTFGITMLALVDGEPKLLPLKRALQLFIEHRRTIITRRSEHDLRKAEERGHILEGLLIALAHLDEVIKTIRQAPDTDTARERLMKRFKLSERQATAILDLQLRRLAALERQKIEEEHKEIKQLIAHLKDLLAHPQKILLLIKEDMADLKAIYGDKRRSTIVEGELGEVKPEDLIADVPVMVMGLQNGRVTRLLNPGRRSRAEKELAWYGLANNRDELLLLSQRGRGFRARVSQIPDQTQNADGVPAGTLASIESDERLICAVALPPLPEGAEAYLVTASKRGQVKRSALSELGGTRASGTVAMKLDDGDELVGAAISNGADEYLLVTSDGNAICFGEDQVRPMGLVAGGVAGVKLADNATVVGFGLASAGTDLVTVSASGHGKRTKLSEYPRQNRHGVGVRTAELNARSGPLVGAWVAGDEDQATLLSAKGTALVTQAKLIGRAGRVKKGATLVELKQGDTVQRLIALAARAAITGGTPAAAPEPPAKKAPTPPSDDNKPAGTQPATSLNKPASRTEKTSGPSHQPKSASTRRRR
ncbi:MAG: DNA gyrase subunit A [Chloroflexi bacterium]|nr:DNA gyrase subunit A [Chloroflexota bacterium]